MASIRGRYEYDDDDLTPGKKKEGGLHQNLYDKDGNLRANARFIPDEEGEDPQPVYVFVDSPDNDDSDDVSVEELVDNLIRLIEFGIAVAPHVQRFWEKARPVLASKWARRPRIRRGRPQIGPGEVVEIAGEVDDSRGELLVASEEYRMNMSSAEAQTRYLLALTARAFSDEQMRLLANAIVEDDEGPAQLQRRIAELPPQQVKRLIGELESQLSPRSPALESSFRDVSLEGDLAPIDEIKDA